VYLIVHSIFAIRSVSSAVIERTIHVAFEIFCESIETVHGVLQSAIVVATITTAILRGGCGGQSKRQDGRSEN
jgi:hypothetical protein